MQFFYWTGLVCVSNDCFKNNDCYCKITKLWWTSSGCSICVNSEKLEDAARLPKIPVWMSRYMERSSTTQMAEIMFKHWRPSGSFWTKLIWSPISWNLMGETIRKSLIWTWVVTSTKLWMYVRSSKTRVLSVSICGWHQNGRKEAEYGTHVEEMDEKRFFDEPSSFLDHVKLGCTQRECKPNETIIEQYKKMFESRISAGSTENHRVWEKPQTKTVAWSYYMEGHAWKCVGRYCEVSKKWSNFTESQALAWMIIKANGKNSTQLENCHKFFHKLFGNTCIWHEMGDQTFCGLSTWKSSHTMDSGMR